MRTCRTCLGVYKICFEGWKSYDTQRDHRDAHKKMNSDENRKWRGDFYSLLKHYTRGNDWAYSNIRNTENFKNILIMNSVHIFTLIKYLYL